MTKQTASEPILFLRAAVEFIQENWEDKNNKCTQKVIAAKLGVTGSYLSKAKENASYAQNLRRKLLNVIKEIGGTYDPDQLAFIDKNNQLFHLDVDPGNTFPIKLQFGIDKVPFTEAVLETKNIRILTTWSGETYANLIDIIEQDISLWLTFDKIQILMLHPDSEATLMRSKAMGFHAERGFNRIKDDLQEMMNAPAEVKKRLEVRLYDQLPTLKLMLLDNLIVMGFYLFRELSGVGYNFMFKPKLDKTLTKDLERHFNKIWDEATPFDLNQTETVMNKWVQPRFKSHNASIYKSFTGTYCIYYPEQYSANEHYRNHKVAASIGCNILKIDETENGRFSCTMKPVGYPEEEYFEGELVNKEFNNPDYLVLQLRNKVKNRMLHLTFSTKNGKMRSRNLGAFSVIYGASGRIGCGKVVLVPVADKFSALKAESLAPDSLITKTEDTHYKRLGPTAIRYLIQKDKSLLSPPGKIEDLKEKAMPAGVFKVYFSSTGGSGFNQQRIKTGVLQIDSTGLVRYKNRIRGYEGVGWATKNGNNLFIEIVNSNPTIQRTAVFILHTGINTVLEKENTVYCGICAGTTWVDELPAGSRIVITSASGKNFDTLKPESITINSPEYEKLPVGLRKLLTGHTNNILGFFNKSGAIYNTGALEAYTTNTTSFDDLFYKSACFDLLQGDENSCILHLKQAVDHGFSDFDKLISFMKQHKIKSEAIDSEIKRLSALYSL